MAYLGYIWVACRTWNKKYAGTISNLELVINYPGIYRDLHVELTGKQLKGGTNIYFIGYEYAGYVNCNKLTDSSIRIGILGRDLWKPAHIFIWGQTINTDCELEEVIPIAIETEIDTGLSIDPNEGSSSIPIRLVHKGKSDIPIHRLLILMQTSSERYAGTNDPFTLEISTTQGDMVTIPIKPARYKSQEKMLFTGNVPADFTFRKEDVESIHLQFLGDNKWLPRRFHLFGVDTESDRPTEIVTLVDIQDWQNAGLNWLSTDIDEGLQRVELPLYFFREPIPIGPIAIAPLSITDKLMWKVKSSLPDDFDI